MHKIKVLFVHTLPVVSGSGLAVYYMIKGLDKDKYDLEFACAPGGPLIEKIASTGITVRPVKHLVQEVHIIKDILALIEMVFLIRRRKYTIVHTHNSKAGVIGRLAAKISGVPIIIHTFHGFSFHRFERPFRRWLFKSIERFTARLTDKLLIISKPLREWGLSEGIGDPGKYVINYDGIEFDKFRRDFDREKIRSGFGIEDDESVVGMVSKLWEGKGHKYLLQAAVKIIQRVPRVRFMLVGDGYLRDNLKEQAEELGVLDHVIFTGFREDIPEITSIFDIACLPSLFEGMGRVLLEAQIMGRPVVATRVGGIVEIVKDNETGLLIEPADSDALALAIIRLLTDSAMARRLGEAARHHIGEEFSVSRMVEKVEEVYEELLKAKGTAG
ncbi:glycosyltransferase family 4 protein [Candidatus Omnitrophota bacterium]